MSENRNMARAAQDAAKVLDAMDAEHVAEAYRDACRGLSEFLTALVDAGVNVEQACNQLQCVVIRVILHRLGVER